MKGSEKQEPSNPHPSGSALENGGADPFDWNNGICVPPGAGNPGQPFGSFAAQILVAVEDVTQVDPSLHDYTEWITRRDWSDKALKRLNRALNELGEAPITAEQFHDLEQKVYAVCKEYTHAQLFATRDVQHGLEQAIVDAFRALDALDRSDHATLAAVVDGVLGDETVYDEWKFWQHDARRGVYIGIDDNEIGRALQRVSGSRVKNGKDKNGEPKFKPLLVNQNTIHGVIACLQTRRAQPGFFDPSGGHIAFRNCTIAVEQGRIVRYNHSHTFRLRHAYPFNYEPKSEPALYIKLLRSALQRKLPEDASQEDVRQAEQDVADSVECLREFTGASILGDATKLQKALLIYGPGKTSKSVETDIAQATMPEGSVASVPPQKMSDDKYRADLLGKRLNVHADISSSAFFDSSDFKASVTGDLMSARRVYKDPVQFRPRCGHLYSMNRLFGTKDHTTGLSRRMVPIEFANVVPDDQINRNLAQEIIDAELAQIVCWAIEGGAQALARGHLTVPKSSEEGLRQWQLDTDPVAL